MKRHSTAEAESPKKCKEEVVLFWKPSDKNGALSNWSKHSISADGLVFKTAEHYMMYHKATIMGDSDSATRVLASPSPYEAKRIGRQVRNWDEARWASERERVMLEGLWLKASQHKEIKQLLMESGDCILAEASPFDRIWGIGLAAHDKAAACPGEWKGLNLLGNTWMKVRDAIRVSEE